MDERNVMLMVALVLCVCGALVYLDWRRQGEIEFLHERIDGLDAAASRALSSLRETARWPTTVDRILHASDDRTLADIAREGAR